jgi:hypothetical protein
MRRAVVFTLLSLASACSAPGRLRIAIGPDELQRNVEKSFPIARELSIATLELTGPEILLAEGADKLGLRARVRVTVALLAVDGMVAACGKLRYQPEEAAFYLDDPEVTELEVPGLPAEHKPDVLAAINLALGAVLARVPVHRLEGGAAKRFLRSMRVEDGRVVVELGI